MIKTLLNADEDPPPGTKVVIEDTVLNPPAPPPAVEENAAEITAAPENFEIPEDAKHFAPTPENAAEAAPALDPQAAAAPHAAETAPLDDDEESLTALMAEIENLEPEEFDRLEREIRQASEPADEISAEANTAELREPSAFSAESDQIEAVPVEAEKTNPETPETVAAPNHSDWLGKSDFVEESAEKKIDAPEATIFQTDYTPPTTAETIRNSGLAWSAGIVFFAAVVFMMIFGWFADLLFGSSPWGLVGGIVLGGIIGFIQIFRISSQIFKK